MQGIWLFTTPRLYPFGQSHLRMSFVHLGGWYCAPEELPPPESCPPPAMPPAVVPPMSSNVRTAVTPRDLTLTPLRSCRGDPERDARVFACSLIASISSADGRARFSRRSSPTWASSCGSPCSLRSLISAAYTNGHPDSRPVSENSPSLAPKHSPLKRREAGRSPPLEAFRPRAWPAYQSSSRPFQSCQLCSL